jgi:hypothetical protein
MPLDPATRTRVQRCLEAGTILAASAGPAIGYFTSATLPIALNLVTDGEWLWHSDLAHYVRERDTQLESDFVRKAASGVPKPVSLQTLLEMEQRLLGQS